MQLPDVYINQVGAVGRLVSWVGWFYDQISGWPSVQVVRSSNRYNLLASAARHAATNTTKIPPPRTHTHISHPTHALTEHNPKIPHTPTPPPPHTHPTENTPTPEPPGQRGAGQAGVRAGPGALREGLGGAQPQERAGGFLGGCCEGMRRLDDQTGTGASVVRRENGEVVAGSMHATSHPFALVTSSYHTCIQSNPM
jgi:hypothetical protein